MDYPQTRTQNLTSTKKKMIFSATPSPSGVCNLPPNFWYDPLDENFYHNFVALTLKGG